MNEPGRETARVFDFHVPQLGVLCDDLSMLSPSITGSLVVIAAGLILGTAAWPMKCMKVYRFEHWWLVAMTTGLIFIPWGVTLSCCPNAAHALASIPWRPLVIANLWSAAWGVANVLGGLCFVRIGVALTTAILTGLGASIGVILPMIVKGSGVFRKAPDIGSSMGISVLAGVAILIAAVILSAMAGHAREKQNRGSTSHHGFLKGLCLAIAAGILSSGMVLSFIYSQDAIVHAMKAEGAGDIAAVFAVWAFSLGGGALVSVGYPLARIVSGRSWSVLFSSPRGFGLAAVIGFNLSVGLAIMARGMIMLGPLGGSVGWGIQQITWMLGGQAIGLASGEWRGITRRTRLHMRIAIGLLLLALIVLGWTNSR